MKCVECGRALRGPKVEAAMAPGTVVLCAKGMCARCYRRKRLASGAARQESAPKPAPIDIGNSPSVLVRVDLTPNTYKALRAAGVRDIGSMLSRLADQVVAQRRGVA